MCNGVNLSVLCMCVCVCVCVCVHLCVCTYKSRVSDIAIKLHILVHTGAVVNMKIEYLKCIHPTAIMHNLCHTAGMIIFSTDLSWTISCTSIHTSL